MSAEPKSVPLRRARDLLVDLLSMEELRAFADTFPETPPLSSIMSTTNRVEAAQTFLEAYVRTCACRPSATRVEA